MAKCSRDVALLLDVLVDATKTSPPLKGYTSIITGAAAWADLKVGVLNPVSWLYDETSAGYTNKSKEQIVCFSLRADPKIPLTSTGTRSLRGI